MVENMVVDEDAASVRESKQAAGAAAWTAALLPLVKGKTTMDRAKMAHTNLALREVERANEGGQLSPGVLKVKKTPVQIVISTLESADDGNMSGERAGGHRAEAW